MSTHTTTMLIEPSNLHQAVDILLTMDVQDFSDVVDRDIRGNERLQRDEQPLHALYSEALRGQDVCERWYQELVQMKKSTELTIAAKGMDDKARRAKLQSEGSHGKARDTYRHHLQWRAGAVRFLTGVEARLSEANYCRRKHWGSSLPSHIIFERDELSAYVRLLRRAILEHRDDYLSHDGDEPSDADAKLWSVLDQRMD